MTKANCSGLGEYIIKVRSHIDDKKSYWFEGMMITTDYDEKGRPMTVFTGHLDDQAALHGVLAKIRDMNLPLISVNRILPDSLDDDLKVEHDID